MAGKLRCHVTGLKSYWAFIFLGPVSPLLKVKFNLMTWQVLYNTIVVKIEREEEEVPSTSKFSDSIFRENSSFLCEFSYHELCLCIQVRTIHCSITMCTIKPSHFELFSLVYAQMAWLCFFFPNSKENPNPSIFEIFGSRRGVGNGGRMAEEATGEEQATVFA